uniref:Ubiquinone biosynthesis O-methyltransferase, mitochondrial n=1 Tax=Culicoides sonorensis TaxID=179676 RepID=A0A336KST0_CULSO
MVKIKSYLKLFQKSYLFLNRSIVYKSYCTKSTSQSIDHDDVKNLNNFSNDWWNSDGPLKALHSMNDIRVPFIRDGLISNKIVQKHNINTIRVLENVKILEVGCGGGILTEPLARLHGRVTGLDPGADLLKVAKEHLLLDKELENRIQYCAETVEDHAKANVEKYDAVVASEVLEHVSNKAGFLEACIMALRPGGSLFLTTLNRTNLSWLLGILVAENVLNLLPPGTHSWDKFTTPEELERLLKDNNCSVSLIHGMKYEFWCNQWDWTECLEINYAVHAIKNQ